MSNKIKIIFIVSFKSLIHFLEYEVHQFPSPKSWKIGNFPGFSSSAQKISNFQDLEFPSDSTQ
uniref:Ovule protein n=1 Tax=Romanomermis culicivorax TaxID=13658 RepID=A0A915KC20_ROMCU